MNLCGKKHHSDLEKYVRSLPPILYIVQQSQYINVSRIYLYLYLYIYIFIYLYLYLYEMFYIITIPIFSHRQIFM